MTKQFKKQIYLFHLKTLIIVPIVFFGLAWVLDKCVDHTKIKENSTYWLLGFGVVMMYIYTLSRMIQLNKIKTDD